MNRSKSQRPWVAGQTQAGEAGGNGDDRPGHLLTLAKDGRHAWSANIASGSVSLIDLDRGTVVKTSVIGSGPEGHDVSPDGRELWAADRTLNKITVLDAAGNQPVFQVVDPSTAATLTSPRPKLYALVALVVALVLTGRVAFIMSRPPRR